MTRAERNGLVLLIIFLLSTSVLCTLTTNRGRAFGNIFARIAVYIDDPRTPSIEAQFEPIKEQLGVYFLIGTLTAITGLLTLVFIVVYLLVCRRVPRTWCLLLMLIGLVTISLILAASQLQSALAAVPIPERPLGSGTHDGLEAGVILLGRIGLFGGGLFVFGLILIALSWQHAKGATRHELSNYSKL